jgi:cytoplasmic iron level regulating protein YaaA (DUF328/UPF0246 family)
MKILISPAKSLETKSPENVALQSVPVFLKESTQLIRKLQKLSVVKLEKMMHISTDIAKLNYDRFQLWEEPLTPLDSNMPAVFAFNGEVYKGLDVRSLTENEQIRLHDSLFILSGLYGILKPFDLFYPYRLEMGTRWEISAKQKNLYQFWGTKLASFLNQNMDSSEVLLNLASAEYFKAIDKKTLKAKVITPVFKEFKNGTFKVVMMYAKHARGAMARYCVVNNIQNPEELKLYTVDGYQFDANQSTADEWVFIR